MAKKDKSPAPAPAAPESEWDGGNGDAAPEAPKAPEAPQATPTAPGEATAAPDVEEKLPDNFKDALAALIKARATPRRLAGVTAEENESYEQERASKIAALEKHVHTLQQGCPVLHLGADDHVKGGAKRAAVLQRERWELAARDNPIVKEILDAHDKLAKELAAPKK